MKNNFFSWARFSIWAITVLPTGSLLAADVAAQPTLRKVFPDAVYADEDEFRYPVYHLTVFGENRPQDSSCGANSTERISKPAGCVFPRQASDDFTRNIA
jgi:hypothetical protein